jgi:hypothetical protein
LRAECATTAFRQWRVYARTSAAATDAAVLALESSMTLRRVRQWRWVAAAVRKGRALLEACHDLLRAHRLGCAWAGWCAHQARAVRIAGRAEAGWRAVQARLCATLLEAWVSTCK